MLDICCTFHSNLPLNDKFSNTTTEKIKFSKNIAKRRHY